MDDDNESVDSTEGLPVRNVIIDEDPDDDTPRTSQEPVNAYNAVKCAECAALRDNAHRAWEMVASYAEKAHRLIELENQNHMLSQINDEQHTYVGEQARQLKEMKAQLNEVDELRRDTEDRMRLLQSQYEQVLQKANEGRKHMEAANEWREKYDASQKLLVEVDALRKGYMEKYKSSIQIAADFSDKSTKAAKDMEKLQATNAKMNAELTAFRRYFPRVFAVANELRRCAAANPAVPTKVLRKADKVLEDIIVQSLTLKKRPAQAVIEASAAGTSHRSIRGESRLVAEEASEGVATTSEPEFSDEGTFVYLRQPDSEPGLDAAAEEIENLLQNGDPASAAEAPSTSASIQPSTSRKLRESSTVPQTSTSGSCAQDDSGLTRAFEDLLSTDAPQTPRRARVAHTPKKTQHDKDQEKPETGKAYSPLRNDNLITSTSQSPAGPSTPTETPTAAVVESPSRQSKRARKAPLFDVRKTPAKQPPSHRPPPAPIVLEQRPPTTSSFDDYVDGVLPGDFTPDSSPEKAPVRVTEQEPVPIVEVVPIEVYTLPTPQAQKTVRPVREAHEATTGAAASGGATPATEAAVSVAEDAPVNAPRRQSIATSSEKTEAVSSAASAAPEPAGQLPRSREAVECQTQPTPPAQASARPVTGADEVATGAATKEAPPETQAADSTAVAAPENAPQRERIATSSTKTDTGALPGPREEARSSKDVAAGAGRKPSVEAILTSPFFREFENQPLIPALEPTVFSFEPEASASTSLEEPQKPAAASDNALDHLMESIDAVASLTEAKTTRVRRRSSASSSQAAATAPQTEPSSSAQQASEGMPPPKRVARVAGPRRPGAAPHSGAGSGEVQPKFPFQRPMTESEDDALLSALKAAGEPMDDLDLSFMQQPKKKTSAKKSPGGKAPAKKLAPSAAPAKPTAKRPTAKTKMDAAPPTAPLPLEVRYNLPTPLPRLPRRGRTMLSKLLSKTAGRSSSSSSLTNADPDQPSTSGISANAALPQQPQPSTSSASTTSASESPDGVPQRKSLCKGITVNTSQKQPSTTGKPSTSGSSANTAALPQQPQPSTSSSVESPSGVPQRQRLCKGTAANTNQKTPPATPPNARRATVGVKRTMGSQSSSSSAASASQPPAAARSTPSSSQPEAKRAKLIDLPVPQRPTKGQVAKGGVAGKRADALVKTKPETAAAARRAEVGSANSIVLSHFQQAAQHNKTKSVYERAGELLKSFEAKMAESPELRALSVETLAGLMVRATIDMDVGDLWQSTKQAAHAGTVTCETVLSRNEKVVLDFAHVLADYDQWNNLMAAYFSKMSAEVSRALPTSSPTLKAMHFRILTFTYLLMENEARDAPEKKGDVDKAYPTLCLLVQLLVQNQPPPIAVPILCYVAAIHPEFFRKAVHVKANEHTAFRRLLRLQLSGMPDKISVVNKVIVGALGLQPAVNHPYVVSPTSRELETWTVEEIDRALEITEPFPKDASGRRQVSRAVHGALRPITAFLAPYFKPALDRAALMRRQFARLFAFLEDPHAATELFDALPERCRKMGILATLLARTLFTLLNNPKTAEKAVLQGEIHPDAKQKLIDYAARYKTTAATKPEFELLVAGLEDALRALP
ncbi:hypothetical protein AAVH_08363 [Aphelenchoides avenae]|nr:hypothetical protein AAVH_08363 [Aphelenchus avenae]